MTQPDQLRISRDQNPAFFEYLADKKTGDPLKVEVQGTLKDVDAESGTITVEAVVPEGFEVDDSEAIPPVGDSEMTPTAIMVRRKANG